MEKNPLSRGGFGEVYKGKWKGKAVAIKKILLCSNAHQPDNGANERVNRERIAFEKEANLLYSLSHPKIVKVSLSESRRYMWKEFIVNL
jgi:serine/threonine protein kinase